MQFEILMLITQSIIVGLCLFCANLLMLRRRDEVIYVPLALLFLFQALSYLPRVILEGIIAADLSEIWEFHFQAVTAPLEFASPFLFWLYVRALTIEGEVTPVPRKWLHAIPIIIGSLCLMSGFAVPAEMLTGQVPPLDELLQKLRIVARLYGFANVLFMVMVAVYIALTILRLKTYHKRLKDIFASTENRELHWIWLITLSAGMYLLLSFIDVLSDSFDLYPRVMQGPAFDAISEFCVLVLMWVIGVWGLRQRRGFNRGPVVPPAKPVAAEPAKYQHSALDDTRALRIAAKIEASMSADFLHRDPNLSLWDLAKHISVTAHYVSQTLNTKLDRNFFDYVNYWRIKDAVNQLTTTEDTILAIAYDVGFNSRSSFYKAFKRETGKTPRDLRAQ